MAEAEAPSPPPTPPFLEVKCKSSGKTRRFAAGTEAGFAVSVINRKLTMISAAALPHALYIEAIREAEPDEPITFGPNSVLVNYGDGWNLQTVTDLDFNGIGHVEDNVIKSVRTRAPHVNSPESSSLTKNVTKPTISYVYVGKIILAFILLFLLAAIFTLALENLPLLISFVTSSSL